MGIKLKDKQGNTIAKLLQFVATDSQVNKAITQYLDENGISLAEGVDLKQMDKNIEKNKNDITGLKETISESKKAQTNILLQYKDHFIDGFETGYIDDKTGMNTSDLHYIRSAGFQKIKNVNNSVLIADIPENHVCAYYFYDAQKIFQGATTWLTPADTYKLSQSQTGWYIRAIIYCAEAIDLDTINIILAGSAVTKILDNYKKDEKESGLLKESELNTEDVLELNITRAALESSYSANCAVIPFFTDLHISCEADKSVEEIAASAAKIRKHLACFNILAEKIPIDVCVYGGDYLNNSAQTKKEAALNGHAAVKSLINQTNNAIPVFITKGNHDDNTMYSDYKNGYIDSEQIYRTIADKDAKLSCRDTDYIEKMYGYYDIPNKKIRVFMLNSDDLPTSVSADNKLSYGGQNDSGFSQEQLKFVADNLVFTEKGWQVIFFSHHPLRNFTNADTEADGYTCNAVTASHGGNAMLELILAFKNKQKGTIKNNTANFVAAVDYDFTENKSDTIIACVCGHTHVYCHKETDGIHYIATRAIYGHPTYSYISTSYYIVIDRVKKKIKLIANGDGDDHEYDYGAALS